MKQILSESYFTGEEMEAIKSWPAPEKSEINLIFLSSQGPQREQDWIFLHQEPMAILSTCRTAKNSTIFWLFFQWINHSTFQTLKWAQFLHQANFTPANFLCFPPSSTWFTTQITGLPPRKWGENAQGSWASTKYLLCKGGLTYSKLKKRGLTINKFRLEMERKIPLEA